MPISYPPSSGLSAIGAKDVLSNNTGVSAVPIGNTLSSYLDAVFGTTNSNRGAVAYRGAVAWAASLGSGNNGNVFQANSGGDPSWETIGNAMDGYLGSAVGGFAQRGATAWGETSFQANGTGVAALGSLAPAGAGATPASWLKIVDASGTARYIPCF